MIELPPTSGKADIGKDEKMFIRAESNSVPGAEIFAADVFEVARMNALA